MARISLLPADLTEPREVVDAVRARRGGTLFNIDRLLLYSPPFAAGWTAHAGAVRTQLSLPSRLRELAIVSVCHLMGTDYEVGIHGRVFVEAGGTQAQLDSLRDVLAAAQNVNLFDDVERAVLSLSIEMTRSIVVRDETFARAKKALNDTRSLVELIGIIATYNMTNRFLTALDFGDGELL